MKAEYEDMEALNEETSLLDGNDDNYSTFERYNESSPGYFSGLANYLPSWSTLQYGTAAILATLPFVPYCFTSSPESITAEWWLSKSANEQIFLLVNSLAFLGVNTATRFKYFQFMKDKLKEVFTSYHFSLTNKITILLASAASGAPSGALGYFALEWAGKAMASVSAFFSFLSTSAVRIVFVSDFLTKLRDIFNEDRQFQKKIQNDLKQLNSTRQTDLNHALVKYSGKTINEKMMQKMLQDVFNQALALNLHQSSPLLNQSRRLHPENLRTLVAIAGGFYLGASFSAFTGQGSFEAAKLVCSSFTKNCPIDDLAYLIKLSFALLPGFTGAIVGFMSGLEFFEETIGAIILHLRKKPVDIIKTCLMLGCCLLTSWSSLNAAERLTMGDNLFGLTAEPMNDWQSLYLWLYLVGNYGAALTLNVCACSKLLGLSDNLETTPSINQLNHWLSKNLLTPETLSNLRHHRFFSQPRLQEQSALRDRLALTQ